MYALAERLGKTVTELVTTMPEHEREGWIAYIGHQHRQRELDELRRK